MSEQAASLMPEIKQQLDHWIAKYPPEHKRSAILPGLMLVQKANGGWLTESLMNAVADYLEIPRIYAYEVVTFYSMYELEKVGRHKISVCTNISCMLCGSEKIMSHLQNRLGIKPGETTADGRFSLREVECLGACVGAPTCQIGDDYHENLTTEKVDQLLEGLE